MSIAARVELLEAQGVEQLDVMQLCVFDFSNKWFHSSAGAQR
jgi:hypothetical protein